MPSPYANVGGGPGGPDDSFLGLDSGNFWSRFGLPEPGGPPPIDTASPMGPVDAMPNSQTPMTELEPVMPDQMETGYPLDAMYSMIGMSPLTADSMGRYNLTDDQRRSASNHSLANTLGTAAQVMFGTASADDMIKAGLNYGARRDAALDKYSATNKADYDTKVEMAVKGSNLMRQQVLVEAEQEKLKEIMEQKEYGAHWVETMEPVWEKYANELAVGDPSKGIKGDPDRAQQYAAALQMVRAKAMTGDMSAATQLFDAASNEMITSVWKKNQEEDMVKAQFARAAEFTGFKEADEALRAVLPDWRMGMKDGKAVPMSPADQEKEAATIDGLKALAQDRREVNANSSVERQRVKMFVDEQNRINKIADEGGRELIAALHIIGSVKGEDTSDNKALADANGKLQKYLPYLQASKALSNNPETFQKEVQMLATSPEVLRDALARGAMAHSTIFGAMQAGGGTGMPASSAGSGGVGAPIGGGPPNIGGGAGRINEMLGMVGKPGGPSKSEALIAISTAFRNDPGGLEKALSALDAVMRGESPGRVYASGGQGPTRLPGAGSGQAQ